MKFNKFGDNLNILYFHLDKNRFKFNLKYILSIRTPNLYYKLNLENCWLFRLIVA